MNPHSALTFHLVEQHLGTLLPPVTLADLAPWFEGRPRGGRGRNLAGDPVAAEGAGGLPHPDQAAPGHRPDDSGQPLRGPAPGPPGGGDLPGADEAKTYPVHPLGLVVMEQVVYLVCTLRD